MKKTTTLLIFALLLAHNLIYGQKHMLIDHLNSRYNIDVTKNFSSEPRLPYFENTLKPDDPTISSWVKSGGGSLFQPNTSVISNVQTNAPASLLLNLPTNDGKRTVSLQLVRVNVFGDGFNVVDSENNEVRFNTKDEVHYQGIIKGNENSIAAVSFFKDGSISGMVSGGGLDLSIGKMKNSNLHVVYDQKFVMPTLNTGCNVSESRAGSDKAIDWSEISATPASGSCKVLGIYFELDNDMFTKKGSNIQNTASYMSGIFNQVKLLYANEGVEMEISRIKVWNTPDPYVSYTDTEPLVEKFQENLNGDYPGHVANFISGRIGTLGGGIAYDIPLQLCTKANQVVVSAINDSYSNVPTYSWTVSVITHEMGHILGSRHTHWCGWSGGPIDGCAGYAETDSLGNSCSVGPIPSGGGTIMSYCHTVSAGINFNLGFGLQPGNIIRAKIAAASCITTNGVTGVPTGLSNVSIVGNDATVQWDLVSGANYYQIEFKESTSDIWIYAGQSTSNTFSFSSLNLGKTYNWRVKTSCSNYSSVSSFVVPANFLKISSPLPFTTICKNSYISLNYEASGFMAGNLIVAELSDASGSFTSPIVVGSVISNTSGVMSISVPSGVPDGAGYRLRLKTNLPVSISLLTVSFSISNESPTNFVSFNAGNPSDNSFRVWVSADQPSVAHYVVLINSGSMAIPTTTQILNGKDGNGSTAMKSGSLLLVTANQEYHKIVDGLPSGMSLIVFFTLDNASACQKPIAATFISTTGSAGVPSSCVPSLNCTDNDFINNFTVSGLGINITSSGCSSGGYADRMNNVYFAQKNTNYSFNLTTGSYTQYINIWIDKNMNGVFEASEIAYSSGNTKYSSLSNIITVPNATGVMKMRVLSSYSYYNPANPCLSGTWGEAEDFILYVSGSIPCPNSTALISPTHDVTSGIGKIYRGLDITGSNKITGYSASEYYGVKSITLNPGFTAEQGTLFTAKIDSNCGN